MSTTSATWFDSAGWAYAGIGTARQNIVAFNPQTRERKQMVDGADGRGHRLCYTGVDGKVYGSGYPVVSPVRRRTGAILTPRMPPPHRRARSAGARAPARSLTGAGSVNLPDPVLEITDLSC